MNPRTEHNKPSTRDVIAGVLFGVGIAFGFIPILLASLLVRENLFLEVFDRMDNFWKSRQRAV